MVQLHVKRGDESQVLFSATVHMPLDALVAQVTAIYNGRLKVDRICSEMAELVDHGIMLPPNMQGLTDDQISELKLRDEWEGKCVPSGGATFQRDEMGRRNGHAPNEKMKDVLKKTMQEAKALISKKQVQANVCVTLEMVKEALDQLRGAVMIVYPMGLPPHDPIRMEFEDKEDLSGTQVCARFYYISICLIAVAFHRLVCSRFPYDTGVSAGHSSRGGSDMVGRQRDAAGKETAGLCRQKREDKDRGQAAEARPGGASEGAARQRGAAEADDAALPPKARGTEETGRGGRPRLPELRVV
ncbi:cilia- and flagella-associated protein 298 isoform X2 [Denticeps clupeoides]|uniref:cilia- and flagella-associated protein 298 isoform X2 n=1 Tax=Denticeps clupeoides TaxID=299321 RepID=UPI0010A3FC43|nr:cilia- and flagella-associated protein 298 isoform X2 [Denticeps clupeoides]